MSLTPLQTLVTIAVIALGTMITRFTPFILFPENKKVPEFVTYLGKVLPTAMIGLLVVYCFKDVSFRQMPFGIQEAAAILCIILLHKWKHNVLLSIAGGTAVYMLLVQIVFK